MKIISGFWDHSGKPSVFVVMEDGKQIYRGTFVDGYDLYVKKKSQQFKNCEINQGTFEVQSKS